MFLWNFLDTNKYINTDKNVVSIKSGYPAMLFPQGQSIVNPPLQSTNEKNTIVSLANTVFAKSQWIKVLW